MIGPRDPQMGRDVADVGKAIALILLLWWAIADGWVIVRGVLRILGVPV